ncbi:tetratricopeptide repeat protein [Pedobacter metabolipauper]|uniref:SH3 domain-containing protein n=1 Tax=Pedobacter metabolipauper TaxID=425513 RepID=A0A4R6SS80_9SPHI|nr:tetratricopeptide repeat protein [Pedobacter metabolipauper]TDQ07094.1 SH3 domain-containing protein [Pedobacter metabolipauper]
MKCNLYVLFFITLPLFSLGKETQEELFSKGNAHYAKGHYTEAVQAYQQVLDSGYRSAAIYFNLGNAHYKEDEIALAILNYERAYKLAPGDEDIAVNLQFANLKITDKIEAVPEFFLSKWGRSALLFFSLKTLSVWSILLSITGFLLLVVYLFSVSYALKKVSFYSGVAALVFAILAIVFSYMQQGYFDSHQQAIVFNGTVNVKSAPADHQKTLFVIHEGTKVKISKRDAGWIRVELPNGNTGWIESASAQEI